MSFDDIVKQAAALPSTLVPSQISIKASGGAGVSPAVVEETKKELEELRKYPSEITAADLNNHAAAAISTVTKHVLKPLNDRGSDEAKFSIVINDQQTGVQVRDSEDAHHVDSAEYMLKYTLKDESNTASWKYWVGRKIPAGRLKNCKVVYLGSPLPLPLLTKAEPKLEGGIDEDIFGDEMEGGSELTIAHVSWVYADPDGAEDPPPLYAGMEINGLCGHPCTYPNGLIECVYVLKDPAHPESAVFVNLSSRKAEHLEMLFDNSFVIANHNRITVPWGGGAGVQIPIMPDRFFNKKLNGMKQTKTHKKEAADLKAKDPEAENARIQARIRANMVLRATESIRRRVHAHQLRMAKLNQPTLPRASVLQMFPPVFSKRHGTALTGEQLFARFAKLHKLDPSMHQGKFMPIMDPLRKKRERKPASKSAAAALIPDVAAAKKKSIADMGEDEDDDDEGEEEVEKPHLQLIGQLCNKKSMDVFPEVVWSIVHDEEEPLDLQVVKDTDSGNVILGKEKRNREKIALAENARKRNMKITEQCGAFRIEAQRALLEKARNTSIDPEDLQRQSILYWKCPAEPLIRMTMNESNMKIVAETIAKMQTEAAKLDLKAKLVQEQSRRLQRNDEKYADLAASEPQDVVELSKHVKLHLKDPIILSPTEKLLHVDDSGFVSAFQKSRTKTDLVPAPKKIGEGKEPKEAKNETEKKVIESLEKKKKKEEQKEQQHKQEEKQKDNSPWPKLATVMDTSNKMHADLKWVDDDDEEDEAFMPVKAATFPEGQREIGLVGKKRKATEDEEQEEEEQKKIAPPPAAKGKGKQDADVDDEDSYDEEATDRSKAKRAKTVMAKALDVVSAKESANGDGDAAAKLVHPNGKPVRAAAAAAVAAVAAGVTATNAGIINNASADAKKKKTSEPAATAKKSAGAEEAAPASKALSPERTAELMGNLSGGGLLPGDVTRAQLEMTEHAVKVDEFSDELAKVDKSMDDLTRQLAALKKTADALELKKTQAKNSQEIARQKHEGIKAAYAKQVEAAKAAKKKAAVELDATADSAPAKANGASAPAPASGGAGTAKNQNPLKAAKALQFTVKVDPEQRRWLVKAVDGAVEHYRKTAKLEKLWKEVIRPAAKEGKPAPTYLLPGLSKFDPDNPDLKLLKSVACYILFYDSTFIDFDEKLPPTANTTKFLREYLLHGLQEFTNTNVLASFGHSMLEDTANDGPGKMDRFTLKMAYLKLKHEELVKAQRTKDEAAMNAANGGAIPMDDSTAASRPAAAAAAATPAPNPYGDD